MKEEPIYVDILAIIFLALHIRRIGLCWRAT
jgi:hypothetical protein